jgi:glycerol-3-phosphate dehydrogenase (NAD(P)+)
MPRSTNSSHKIPSRVVIIGPGRWGSALGATASENFKQIFYLGEASTEQEWDKAFQKEAPLCILACPFRAVESVLKKLQKRKVFGVINAAKGIDRKTLLTFTSLAKKYLRCPFATLSGPTFAQEVLKKKPSACVLAGKQKSFVTSMARKLTTLHFRIYPSTDPIGVEACGAIKNVLAIACGVSDGLKLGHNARAALLTRGLREMGIVVQHLGGKPATVFGLAGVGDLWLTATGDLSRNRQFGMHLARGHLSTSALKKIKGPAEGFYTVRQVVKLAKKYRLDLPICKETFLICEGSRKPKEALQALMAREIRAETV